MGALSKLASKTDEVFGGLRRSGDEVLDQQKAAASFYGKSVDDLTDAEFQRFLDKQKFVDDLNSGLSGRQKLLGGLGLTAGGAYAVGEWQQAEQATANADRYAELQNCIARIDKLEATGKISSSEADERRERCYAAYNDPSGNTPDSLAAWLASLGMVELIVLGLAAAWVLVSVLPSLVEGILDSGKMEEVLG